MKTITKFIFTVIIFLLSVYGVALVWAWRDYNIDKGVCRNVIGLMLPGKVEYSKCAYLDYFNLNLSWLLIGSFLITIVAFIIIFLAKEALTKIREK